MTILTSQSIFRAPARVQPVAPKSSLEIKLVKGISDAYMEPESSVAYAVSRGVQTHSPAAARDITKDIVFDCEGYNTNGVARHGVGIIYAISSGGIPFKSTEGSGVATAYITSSGGLILGNVFAGVATAYASAYGELLLEALKKNWIRWSDIGNLDFEVTKKNVAGEMPLDWAGRISNIRKLGARYVAYGENGVSFISPVGKLMGLNTIHRIGLLGRDAFAGNDFIHFFADKLGTLYQISETLEKLDYKEYLSNLTDPVFTFDDTTNILHICDGTTGYMYSPDTKSFGEGPVNITGIGYKSGSLYVAAPASIVTPTFEIWTQTHDFGSRNGKNISSLDVGTNLNGVLEAAIRFRQNKASAFSRTDWYTVDPRGQSFIPCFGYEFQFGLKANVYEYFEIDYLNIGYKINAY